MSWNWQRPDWPRFSWSAERLARAEEQFLLGAGAVEGVLRHLDDENRERLTVEAMSEEALTTSEIEGELLDRDSVQSSIRRQLGLATDNRRSSPADRGIAEMVVDLTREPTAPIDDATLFGWHEMLMQGRRDLDRVGAYRTLETPMRLVSGRIDDPEVHFEAPPSDRVPSEMTEFVRWFNDTAPAGSSPLPALTRSGLAQLYFVSIHPFEDGNGRIGRALSEKALAQNLGRPSRIALAATILARQRDYYGMLAASNQRNEVSDWLAWFAGIALEARQRSLDRIEFLIDQTRLMDALRDQLNERQQAVLMRVFRAGLNVFQGGLSAGNYVSIARTSPATATRDLADLVRKGALTRTGERRHTRYHLSIPLRPARRVTIDAAGHVIVET